MSIRGSGNFDKESVKKDIADCDAMLLSSLKVDREILDQACAFFHEGKFFFPDKTLVLLAARYMDADKIRFPK